MINVNQLVRDFKGLTYEQQKQKVINFLTAIYDKTGQFQDVLGLVQKVEHVPAKVLLEIYSWLIEYGRDMNDIKVKEKIWKTAFVLQKIWEAEAKSKIKDMEDLKVMEQMMEEIADY